MPERTERRARDKRTFHASSKVGGKRRRSADRAADSAHAAQQLPSSTHRSRQTRSSTSGIRIGGSDRPGRSAMWREVCHPDDRARVVASLRAAVAKHEKLDIEIRLQGADGTYRWWSVTAMPRFGAKGRDIGALSEAPPGHQAKGRLARKLITAQESERTRIARELHDDIGQRLAVLAARVTASTRKNRATIKDIFKQVSEVSRAVHVLSYRLHPSKLRLIGLVKTLESLSADISSEHRVRVAFDTSGMLSDVTGDAALYLFRIAQEALRNAVKHSGAQNIRVHVAREGHHVRLRVTDDGRGFYLDAEYSEGLGLLTMRERAELMRGTLKIQTARGQGTTIEAVIPTSSMLVRQ